MKKVILVEIDGHFKNEVKLSFQELMKLLEEAYQEGQKSLLNFILSDPHESAKMFFADEIGDSVNQIIEALRYGGFYDDDEVEEE